jgi:type I restriction enzyme R subunit
MLDTGFDCPEVVNLVFARFTKSAILYQQMRGRGTRKSKGKPLFTMFDFVGVSEYHGDEDATGEGGRIAEARPRKNYAPRRLLVVDVDDHIDPLSRAWVTVDEDGRLVFPEAAEAKVAELGARFEAWLLTQSGLTAEQGRWLALLGSQIRANADAWGEVSTGHFAFQPFSSMGGMAQAIRVFGSGDALASHLRSLNAAVYGEAVPASGHPRDTDEPRPDATRPSSN